MDSIVLDPRTIVDILSCFQVNITADDIIHPKGDRVQAIYRAFCTQILDVPEKSLSELPFECAINPETAELHQKSNPLVLLFTTMQCFITDFGDVTHDFTMCDLINPQPKRTRKLLSVVADFTAFYTKASPMFEKTRAEFDDARRAIDIAHEEVRVAEERKNALRSEQDLWRRKENAMLAEINSKHGVLSELLKEAKTNEDRRDAILKSIKDGRQEMVSLKMESESLSSQVEHLSKGIVKSPARLVRSAEDQRARIKDLQKKCDIERQRIHDNSESLALFERTSKLLDERFKEMDRLRALQNEINPLEQDLAESRVLRDEAMKHKLQTKEMLDRLLISGEEEDKAHERAHQLYGARLQDLQLKKEDLIGVVRQLRENAPDLRDELSHLKKEMVILRNQKVQETENARTECAELLSRFNDLLKKYRQAEDLFDSEMESFSNVLLAMFTALDDAERAADDNIM